MSPIRRIASADFLIAIVAVIFFGGCGESATSLPVSQGTAKNSPEQETYTTAELFKPLTQQELAALTKKAEAGNVEAQFTLGMMYRDGFQYDKDGKSLNDEGAEWLKKAANQGHAKAQFNLGVAYSLGKGVTKDTVKAVEWYQKAAAQGNTSAQVELGWMHFKGESIPRDDAKAAEWFSKAAAEGVADAQFALGLIYATGSGKTQDAVKGIEWYQKAAAQGHAGAQYMLGEMYATGVGVPKDGAKAVEWWQKAAAQGLVLAQYNLGVSYADGDGVAKDIILGYAWLNIAAVGGNPDALKGRGIAESRLSGNQLAEAQRISSNWKRGQILVREGASGVASAGATSTPGALSKKGTGTIFLVGKTGHAITNQHVAGGCAELRIQGRDGVAKLVTEDIVNDLALVQIQGTVKDAAAIVADPGKLRQGEDIAVFGFPLNALLSSGGNLTPGVVSAMTGIGNNTNQIQITAPIQPGSSGSPVMNKKGEVVGVVSMKLSDSKMAKATGSVGQNVNFAVSGQTLKTFLDTHKVEYRTGGFLSFERNTADLADEARKWTLVVECWK
ncbi:tetratricopeptide repeat-containing serine protease family protein [Sulfuritalea sp.]|uniref:tetratricopeptide repeat-containing serine protease family protein n=1 Tax=Sulfuritalea sp. TaxID=2480090 RepID=UPI001AC8D9EE|nr:tetratricopeptide repeat-containing serine protease family protein [Sulfuritalea sp.]MBN8476124.1 SEL1-like repeat protein [Sulfuritalea sp.]